MWRGWAVTALDSESQKVTVSKPGSGNEFHSLSCQIQRVIFHTDELHLPANERPPFGLKWRNDWMSQGTVTLENTSTFSLLYPVGFSCMVWQPARLRWIGSIEWGSNGPLQPHSRNCSCISQRLYRTPNRLTSKYSECRIRLSLRFDNSCFPVIWPSRLTAS